MLVGPSSFGERAAGLTQCTGNASAGAACRELQELLLVTKKALTTLGRAGRALAPHGALSPCSPGQPSTHLALIWHLVGRGVFLHDVRSQDLEAPSELGQEQAIRIPWGETDIAGGHASPGARGLHRNTGKGTSGEGAAAKGGTSCAQQKALQVVGTRGLALSGEKSLQQGQGKGSREAAEMCLKWSDTIPAPHVMQEMPLGLLQGSLSPWHGL